MEKLDSSTEQKIMKAAESVFIEKGMTGTRMQEIADKAGINKALLHYYFRSKEKLFEVILGLTLKNIFPSFLKIISDESTIFEKIEKFTSLYIDFILNHPHIPNFVLVELNRNPKNLIRFIPNVDFKNLEIVKQIEEEIKAGKIRDVKPADLIVNIVSMCVFPIVAKPILKTVIFGNEEDDYNAFIQLRKKMVADFIIHSIKIK